MKASGLKEIRILPPLAIARLGAASSPMDNFDVVPPRDNPLGWREIVSAATFRVDEDSGEIREEFKPKKLRFKDDNGLIRPVAPFFEVWARFTETGPLRPLILRDLKDRGLTPAHLLWTVHVANHKVFRRTGEEHDKVKCCLEGIHDHSRHELHGECQNFVDRKTIPLGWVQYIRPTPKFSEIRFRFTPAGGWVYGPKLKQQQPDGRPEFLRDQLYDPHGKWVGWKGFDKDKSALDTNPNGIFAMNADESSRGFLDDTCDGKVEVTLSYRNTLFTSFGRIMSGPPAFAPDTFPIRRIIDELEMHLLGPKDQRDVTNAHVREILQRVFETVRLMNTAVMNGNLIGSDNDVASNMTRQDTNDYRRLYEPIMATETVDALAVQAVHENLFAVLQAQAPPWFAQAFREYLEIGDLSDSGRRRMPAMMRGADGRYLTLTRRQLDTIRKVCLPGPGDKTSITPLHKTYRP
jgi:hypothetical protein